MTAGGWNRRPFYVVNQLLTAPAALSGAGVSDLSGTHKEIGRMGQALKTEWRPASLASDAVRMAESVLQFSPATDAEAL
jgi:hypothetical protein